MNPLRAKWREFICAPEHPYRHLASIGASVQGAHSDALDLVGLDDFLQKLRGDQDVELLADMVDLVSGPYQNFVEQELPRLLDALANEMESRDEIVGPGLRGNPRWDRTVVARIAGTLPVGRYYSRTSHRSFALPENLLLRWLVDELFNSARNLARRSAGGAPHASLLAIIKRCEEAMTHHWLTQLSPPTHLTSSMIEAAKRSRRPEYRSAAALAEARSRLKASGDEARWYSILMLLAVGWLEPVSDDDMFELYALTLVVDVLADELGFGLPEEYGLVATGRGHVALFRSEFGKLRVFFDQSPAIAGHRDDRYRKVVNAHRGVSGNARRPDISIVYDRPGDERFLIVEIKRTSNERYISDSIYKVFGYLYDFATAWRSDQPNPKSVLLVPEGIAKIGDSEYGETVIVSGHDREALALALGSALR